MEQSKREHTVGVLFLFLVALCWGFVASTVKRLTATVDSHTISFFRVSLATVVFAAFFAFKRGDWRGLKWFWPWIMIGALGRAGNYLLYNAGLVNLPSNAVTILAPMQTIGVVILARLIAGEGVQHKWLGLALSLSGLVLIWWNGQGWAVLAEPRYWLGNLMLIAAGFATAVQLVAQKVLAPKLDSLEILLPMFAWATLITMPFAWNAGGFSQAYDAATWALLLFLGVVLTGGSFFFLAEGYKRCAATSAVVITNTSIFLTLVWSRYLLAEQVGAIMILGAVLGVAGAIAVIQADRKALNQEGHLEER